MTPKEILEKAYGSVPKEVNVSFDIDWLQHRGIRYYWLLLVRKMKHRPKP